MALFSYCAMWCLTVDDGIDHPECRVCLRLHSKSPIRARLPVLAHPPTHPCPLPQRSLRGGVLAGWAGTDPCAWTGVVCDQTNSAVLAIELDGYGLEGQLSPALGGLASLRSVDMRRNALTGPLPAAWAEAPELSAVALGNNRLSGPLPASWARLSAVFAEHNRLTGSVPAAWASPASRLGMVFLQGNPELCDDTQEGTASLTALRYVLGDRLRVSDACAEALPTLKASSLDERGAEMQQAMLLEVYAGPDEAAGPSVGPAAGPGSVPGTLVSFRKGCLSAQEDEMRIQVFLHSLKSTAG